MHKWIIWIYIIVAGIFISCDSQESADLVIIGGKVATVDDDFSITEAVAMQDDKIIFVGSNEDVKKYIEEKTKVIE